METHNFLQSLLLALRCARLHLMTRRDICLKLRAGMNKYLFLPLFLVNFSLSKASQ